PPLLRGAVGAQVRRALLPLVLHRQHPLPVLRHQRQPVRAVRVPGPDPRAGGGLDDPPFDRRVRWPLVAVLPRLDPVGWRDPPALGQGGRTRLRRAGTDPHTASVWRLTPRAPTRARSRRWPRDGC